MINKKHPKNIELTAGTLGHFIFDKAYKDVCALECNENFKETAFNKLPKLKRLFDLYIIYFWKVSLACEMYYEHNDFQKICATIEEDIYTSLNSYEESNQILGLTLKDFVKDKKELEAFCKECPVPIGGETKVRFQDLLNFLLPKRFSDYHSTVSCENLSIGFSRQVGYFCQHVFGEQVPYLFDCQLYFPSMLSSTFVESETLIYKMEG